MFSALGVGTARRLCILRVCPAVDVSKALGMAIGAPIGILGSGGWWLVGSGRVLVGFFCIIYVALASPVVMSSALQSSGSKTRGIVLSS